MDLFSVYESARIIFSFLGSVLLVIFIIHRFGFTLFIFRSWTTCLLKIFNAADCIRSGCSDHNTRLRDFLAAVVVVVVSVNSLLFDRPLSFVS